MIEHALVHGVFFPLINDTLRLRHFHYNCPIQTFPLTVTFSRGLVSWGDQWMGFIHRARPR